MGQTYPDYARCDVHDMPDNSCSRSNDVQPFVPNPSMYGPGAVTASLYSVLPGGIAQSAQLNEQRIGSSRSEAPSNKSRPSVDANKGALTRVVTYLGLTLGGAFGIACILLGIIIYYHDGGNFKANLVSPFTREICFLFLNLTFIQFSLYAIETAHQTSLKWNIAFDENRNGRTRLEFNSNFRFLQYSRPWKSANGLPANLVMVSCLAITYACSLMVLMETTDGGDQGYNTVISYLPLLTLGSAILIQVTVCFWAILSTDIPTWSQSPFDALLVLLKRPSSQGGYLLERAPGRCMHALHDLDLLPCPMAFQPVQRPAWDSHPEVRRFVVYIWIFHGMGAFWCGLILTMITSGIQGSYRGTSWAPIANENTGRITLAWQGLAPTSGLLWGMGLVIGAQGGIITTALTCVNHLVSLSRDERIWVEAASEQGAALFPGVRKMFMGNWHMLGGRVCVPVLHWAYGQCLSFDAASGLQIRGVQTLYLNTLGFIGAFLITYLIKWWKPKRQTPMALGHMQTLANLIDEWPYADTTERASPKQSLFRNPKVALKALLSKNPRTNLRLYWGHKGPVGDVDGPFHAGTSDHPLDPPKLGGLYGGHHDLLCLGAEQAMSSSHAEV